MAPASHKTIVKRSLQPEARATLRDTGMLPLTFYLAEVKSGGLPPEVLGITVQPGLTMHVPASQLGDPLAYKYLSVMNTSELTEGNWEVEL